MMSKTWTVHRREHGTKSDFAYVPKDAVEAALGKNPVAGLYDVGTGNLGVSYSNNLKGGKSKADGTYMANICFKNACGVKPGERRDWTFRVVDGRFEQVGEMGPITKIPIHTGELREFKRRKSSSGRKGGERPIARNRKSQRALENWVLGTGVWKLSKNLGLGATSETHAIVNNSRGRGFDFDVILRDTSELQFRVDAKSEFVTTRYQDKQISDSVGVRHFLMNTKRYYEPTKTDAIRSDNGSMWG